MENKSYPKQEDKQKKGIRNDKKNKINFYNQFSIISSIISDIIRQPVILCFCTTVCEFQKSSFLIVYGV